jgi:hypothetical protein
MFHPGMLMDPSMHAHLQAMHDPTSLALQHLQCVPPLTNRKVWHGRDRKGSLDDGLIPNVRGVRVALGTGYDHVEGNRQASRIGLVSDLPPARDICAGTQLAQTPTTALIHSVHAAHLPTHL